MVLTLSCTLESTGELEEIPISVSVRDGDLVGLRYSLGIKRFNYAQGIIVQPRLRTSDLGSAAELLR